MEENMIERKVDPNDIVLPPNYKIEVLYTNLTTPISLAILDDGSFYVGDSGMSDNNGKLIKLTKNSSAVVVDGFTPPLTGITYYKNYFYISHRGKITRVSLDGEKIDLIQGLPSFGDHHNNRVEFGTDGKMYFGQGTATNSGVIGTDNRNWVKKHPYFHDYPGTNIELKGNNYQTPNFLTHSQIDNALTGGYSPFSVSSYSNEIINGVIRASGSILRANIDGSNMELIAWGLRNPFVTKFDRYNRLFTSNHGMDVRGSRPIANSPDEFRQINYGFWYGWPDYTDALPVTLPRFKPTDKKQPTFLLESHPMVPPKPLASFIPHSAIMGFDFNYNPQFGYVDHAFIAEFGAEAPGTTGGELIPHVGHQISTINMITGQILPFAKNKSGTFASYSDEGGFERPIDVVFGKDQALYVLDFGIHGHQGNRNSEAFIPNTGLIWKISKRI